MNGRKIALLLVFAAILLVFLAWFDGGEEPLHRIDHKVAVPERIE